MNHLHDVFLPLTTAQRGLWVGHKIGAADATMNIAEAIEICGPIDPVLFKRALCRVAIEAETVRVRIVEHEGRPQQLLQSNYVVQLPFIDVSAEADPRAAAEAWMLDEVCRPIDMAHDPLWVNALFKAAEDRYFWYQRAHHVVFDGYSGGLSTRRVAEVYTAYIEDREPPPCEFGALASLVEAEAAYRGSNRCERDREYWKTQLSNLPEAVSLARSGHKRNMGGLRRSVGHLPVETVRRLTELGKSTAASLPQVLIGMVAAYYHRATGANDLVFGMPVSGRINDALRRTPGMVANAVTIRLAFHPQMTPAELFAQVAKVVRQSLRHQQYRYEDLRRDLGLVGHTQHLALLGVNIEPFDYQLNFAGASAIPHNISNGSAEDLTVFIYDRGNDSALRFDFDASPALYQMAELDEHRRRLMLLIDAILDNPEQPISSLDVLGEQERQRLLYDWNDTAVSVFDVSVPAFLEAQAAKAPDAPAVVFENTVLSYRELHERSLRQARRLIADGVQPGDIVAVALPRGEQLLIVLLAIMRSGAAYLPIDPDDPSDRVALVLDDAEPKALITLPELSARFARNGLLMMTPEEAIDADQVPGAPNLVKSDGVAYVLYTSGSTGKPKGVEVTHRNLANFLQGMRQQLAPVATDRFLAVTTIIFDIAGLELFLPLTVGACVVIAGGEVLRQPPLLARLIQRSAVTHVQATPSLWQILLASPEARLDGVHVLVGGEALSIDLATRLQKMAARVTQFYGPTETTVWSTAYELEGVYDSPPPIGRPILNTQLYVLDEQRQPVLTGAAGELYIGGEGVAKGYLKRPQLNEERFLADPFVTNGRMYRTGDLVRWRDDGLLEFIGRADNQVKIRGHRVELGEIESQLIGYEGVAEAAVAAHRDAEGAVSLAGYLVPAAGQVLDVDLLRRQLLGRLPGHMVPSSFTILEALPLTLNGKLDRKALPQPERVSSVSYAEPVTPVEKKLAVLWQEIFGLERVGLHDNFFELGGDSLTAAAMIARFPEHFSMELPLVSLFEASTIAGLAAYLQRAETQSDPLGAVLPLHAAWQERPLFCIHPVIGLSWGYAGLLRHLDRKVPIYGLQSQGLRGGVALPGSIEEIASDYLAKIQRIQPEGPYRLLGWSLGGLIGHAIAAQLEALGQQVELLGMMDSYPFVIDKAQSRGDSAQEVRAVLHFLGFHKLLRENPPQTMDELADVLCREYDVFSVPLVREIMKNDPQLIDRVSAVTHNNLILARQYQPMRIDADVLYFHATQKEAADMDGIIHYHPNAWRPFIGGRFEVHDIACHHQAMLDAEHAARVGSILRKRLDRTPQQAPQSMTLGDKPVLVTLPSTSGRPETTSLVGSSA